jgi:hypothetical protein
MTNSVAKQRGYFPHHTLERFVVLHKIATLQIILAWRTWGTSSFPSCLLLFWFPARNAVLRPKLRMKLSMNTSKSVLHEIYMNVCVCYDMTRCFMTCTAVRFWVRRREAMHQKPHSRTQNILPEILHFIHEVASLLTSVLPTVGLHALEPPSPPPKPVIDFCQINWDVWKYDASRFRRNSEYHLYTRDVCRIYSSFESFSIIKFLAGDKRTRKSCRYSYYLRFSAASGI